MNLDELKDIWRSQDLSPLYGVEKPLLHQALRQEHARTVRSQRREIWAGCILSVIMLLIALTTLISLFGHENSGHRNWDYALGIAGVIGSLAVIWTQVELHRIRRSRAHRFGDSLRDQLLRRLSEIEEAATGERRVGLIAFPAALMCAIAISAGQQRAGKNPVPYSEMDWPSLPWIILIVVVLLLELFRWAPQRERRKNLPLKRQLESMLKEIDSK